MSKYTTEVRYICESKAGYEESKGFNDIDTILDNSWDKIFTTDCTFFEDSYKPLLCKKILKHYYTREIGAETVGLWMLWMNRRLEEIMPYYNQLYSSAELEFNPFNDVDVTTTHTGNSSGRSDRTSTEGVVNTKTSTYSEDVVDENTHTATETKEHKYSDTPQGALTNLRNDTYLTNASLDTNTDSDHNTETIDRDSSESTRNVTDRDSTDATVASNTDSFTDRVFGKHGGASYSKLLQEFRNVLLNIDMMVIEEFSDLFMGLW